jgi:SsrA-binding protein
VKIITQNKKAFFDYEIFDRIEAGIVLTGDEVKSIRAGHVSLAGAFATIHDGELFLINCNITPYDKAFQKRKEFAERSRKLLIHRRELNRLVGEISQKGMIIVALKVYINPKGKIKVELGVAKHKKAASKKQSIKERDIDRQARREIKDVYKY